MKDPLINFREILAARGGRWTRPRARVLEVFIKDLRPLTPGDVRRRVGRKVNQASVYRNIKRLVEESVLVAVDHTPAGERYELSEAYRGHHEHLICRDCGQVEDLEECLLGDVSRQVLKRSGFRIDRHELRFFGQCQSCAA
jgi:Fur family transcriptional regulator, ferric uptake regulator